MAAKNPEKQGSETRKEGVGEKGIRWYRNFNAAVGGIALAGAAIAPPLLAAPLVVYGGFNVAQAGGAEVARRFVKKRRVKKQGSNERRLNIRLMKQEESTFSR